MMHLLTHLLPAAALTLGSAGPAGAAPPVSFHLMQIEQVVVGVHGDDSAQAIELRMRSSFQNIVTGSRLRVFDAAGVNPVMITDFGANVPMHGPGVRILIASASFPGTTTPAAIPDFTMTNTIPASYFPAGSLTFESDGGTVYWRISWGGAAYTGPTTGAVTNDADGDFGAPIPLALDAACDRSWLFTGGAGAQSTNNLADYSLSAGAPVFHNNAGGTVSVSSVLGTAFCFGTGCPCGNDFPGAGCMNSSLRGGLLVASGGSTSVVADDLVLTALDLPPNNQGIYYMGDALVNNPFFDGKQCALGTTLRFFHCIQSSGPGGTMSCTNFASNSSGLIVAGSSWYFHAWFRDVVIPSPCGTGANLTNVVQVCFTP